MGFSLPKLSLQHRLCYLINSTHLQAEKRLSQINYFQMFVETKYDMAEFANMIINIMCWKLDC